MPIITFVTLLPPAMLARSKCLFSLDLNPPSARAPNAGPARGGQTASAAAFTA